MLFPHLKSKHLPIIIALTYVTTILLLSAPLTSYRPFYGWESGFRLFLFTVPLLALVYRPVQRFMTDRVPGTQSRWPIFTFLFALSLIPIAGGFFLNGFFDTSTPETVSVMVVDKGLALHKQGSGHGSNYYVHVAKPTPSPLPFSFSDKQGISVSLDNYKLIIPNTSQMTLNLHKGFFGLPWFDHVSFNGYNP